MVEKEKETDALLVYESAMARMERDHQNERDQHKRVVRWLGAIILVLILICAVTNALWVRYESQFVDEEWTFAAYADGDGDAIANGNGEVYYYGGESEGYAP